MKFILPKYLMFATICLCVACNHRSVPVGTSVRSPAGSTFQNPLLRSGPDPWVIQKDTTYYYMNTTGKSLVLHATGKMSELANSTSKIIWLPPDTGAYSKQIWAPEIHFLQGKWWIYFAADDGKNKNHRMYALQCNDTDPLSGKWEFKGKVADTLADKWAIDGSVFEYHNQLYMVWSGWQGDTNISQDIFIAKMKDPLQLEGRRVMISTPTYDWEKTGAPPAVNEGPEALINKNGKLLLVFSASGCWTDRYSLGLLTLKENGDPINPADWHKSPNPVLTTAADSGAYAPGHNGFFVSRDGKENWIIYHANSASGEGCGGVRNPRMQSFSWNADGSPNFGTPVKINTPLQKPGGE